MYFSLPTDLPFVGRTAEYVQLTRRYQAVSAGQVQAVVIQGESGIGKSRLAAEFLNWLTVQPADILAGRAFEVGGCLPYQPVVETLRQRLEQENAPDDLLSDVWLVELSRLLPELHDRYPDLPPPTVDESPAQTRLLEAVARLGEALAARRPLVLFIDDIQWADTASLDLLHYLARVWTERGVAALFLFTLTREALTGNPALETWLAGLDRDADLLRLTLEPLSAHEIEQLTHQLAGTDEYESTGLIPFARWLYTETAGQPLFIAESLKALLEQGLLPLRVGADATADGTIDFSRLVDTVEPQTPCWQGVISPSLRQVIVTRLKRLTPAAAALLTAAAVLGRNCDFDQLCRVADLGEQAALPALDELLNSRLLLETNNAGRPYRFTHDRIRDTVYTEAGDARRRVYHRRALTVLETIGASPAELAPHALAARLTEPAFRYSLAAGDEAMALFAVGNAISHYEQARRLIAADPTLLPFQTDVDHLHHLYARLGRAYELQSDYEQAETVCHEMLTQARSAQHLPMMCAALNRLASLAIYTLQLDQANALIAEAKQIAETSTDQASLAQTEWSLAQLTHHIDDFTASKHHSERTLALAQELDDAALVAGSWSTLGFAQLFLGDIDAAAESMEAARAGFNTLGNRALEADALVGLGAAHLLNGHIEASITAGRAAYAIYYDIDNAFGQVTSQAWLVCALVDHGDYEEALAIVRRNLAAVQSQIVLLKMLAAFSAGLVFWPLGLTEEASALYQEIQPLLTEANLPSYLEQNAAHLAVTAALAGDWSAAHHYARQALSHRMYHALPQFIAPRWPEIEALLRGGDLALAREDLRRWEEWVRRVPRYRPLYWRSAALLAEEEGNIAQAIAYLEEAYRLAETIGLPGEQEQILRKLGNLHQRQGDETKSQQLFQQAEAMIQALAATFDDDSLRAGFLAAAMPTKSQIP